MTQVVTPGNLYPQHFDIGVAIANAISIKPDEVVVSSSAGNPVAAPAAGEPVLHVNHSTTPPTLSYFDGSVWQVVAGPLPDLALSAFQSYDPVTNVLTLEMNDGSTVPVPMTSLIADVVDDASVPLTDAFGVSIGNIYP